MSRKSMVTSAILFFFILASGFFGTVMAQGGYDPTTQTQALLDNEARTVYLGNLKRSTRDIPPLRWNLQLTHAARWFSWDSTENRPDGFCGHQDTQGHWPADRALAFGYLGGAGAENAFCGYLSPEDAIQGWMNSPAHRANLLDPNSREIGLGYYRRDSDGRGYVTQDFGNDAVYAPLIIENEAISTTSPSVNLYIYDRSTGGGFAGLGAATQMMVSNNAQFSGAAWEAYKADKAWTLAGGDGWREVFVKTRDKFNRTLTVSDMIYLGANVPLDEMGAAQMSTTQSQVTIYSLDGGTLPQVQFSAGWLADDTFGSFSKLWGNGERVNDAAAWGGTAYRLYPGDGESFAWVYDTTFIKDTPMVAYFRLKVSDNSSSNEVARIEVQGGPVVYGPLGLKGTDFTASGQYQEFPLSFTFGRTSNDPFLYFKFWRSGNADVYVDAVSIFTAPQAIASPLTWRLPGNHYRGQGIWMRYTDGSRFSEITEAVTIPFAISGNAGLGGVILNYHEGVDRTVVTDENGSYLITVPYGWSGTVTPSHPCYLFTPENRSYDSVTDNLTGQDYTAVPSGTCILSTMTSAGNFDGWILESSETSSLGGTKNNTAATVRAGDDAANKQYRSILSFDTSSLPDNALLTSVTLKFKSAGMTGTLPFSTHGNLLADIRKGTFSGNPALQLGDFSAKGTSATYKVKVLSYANFPLEGWYSMSLLSADFLYINLTGTTQFRLRFASGDNNDHSADFLKIYSGNALLETDRPQLVIEYYVP